MHTHKLFFYLIHLNLDICQVLFDQRFDKSVVFVFPSQFRHHVTLKSK